MRGANENEVKREGALITVTEVEAAVHRVHCIKGH